MRSRLHLLLLFFSATLGCSRGSAQDAPTARGAASVTTTAPVAAPAYPVGRACADPGALAKENKTLPAVDRWPVAHSARLRLEVRVPPGVFRVLDEPDGFRLASSQGAKGLGPDGNTERLFALRFRRIPRGVDAILGDRTKAGPLGGAWIEDAFPKRTTSSFVPRLDEPVGSGTATTMTVAGRPAWVVVTGAHGYDTDWVLVALSDTETLVVDADWNTAIMVGQPECWQRVVIGKVVESLVVKNS
jgi:hypothetical protein